VQVQARHRIAQFANPSPPIHLLLGRPPPARGGGKVEELLQAGRLCRLLTCCHLKVAELDSFKDADWSTAFHVWRMDWDERAIVLSVDGEQLNEVPLSRTVNQDGSALNPFHQPQYLLLNLAIGGTLGGDPSQTAFPSRFEVDYVRVYQATR
jgi:hypothetical protein